MPRDYEHMFEGLYAPVSRAMFIASRAGREDSLVFMYCPKSGHFEAGSGKNTDHAKLITSYIKNTKGKYRYMNAIRGYWFPNESKMYLYKIDGDDGISTPSAKDEVEICKKLGVSHSKVVVDILESVNTVTHSPV